MFKKLLLKSYLFCLHLLTIFSGQITVASHADGDDIIIGKYRIIHSYILNEDRTVSIYLPYGYEENDGAYPVIYILDGSMISRLMSASATMEDLDGRGLLPQMIVVGIDAPNSLRDCFPFELEGREGTGQADNFLKFLSDELIPWVDRNYRTEPFRILSGASNSGLLTVYAFLGGAESFSAYIAASPSIGWNKEFMLEQVKNSFSGDSPPEAPIYMNYGTDDIESIVLSAMPDFVETFTALAPEHLRWTMEVLEDAGHVPYVTFLNGLMFIIPDWKYSPDKLSVDGLDGIRLHYSRLSEKYGFSVKIPSSVLMDLGYEYFSAEDWDSATEVFLTYIKEYPGSGRAHYYLGETYRRSGQIEKARGCFERALEIDPEFGPAKQKLEQLDTQLN